MNGSSLGLCFDYLNGMVIGRSKFCYTNVLLYEIRCKETKWSRLKSDMNFSNNFVKNKNSIPEMISPRCDFRPSIRQCKCCTCQHAVGIRLLVNCAIFVLLEAFRFHKKDMYRILSSKLSLSLHLFFKALFNS